MGKVYVFDHPLIQHKVALMRMKETNVKEFRALAKEIAILMGFEATRNLALEDVDIETPICKTTVKMLKGEDIAIVPILRAGLGFVDGMLELVPNANIQFCTDTMCTILNTGEDGFVFLVAEAPTEYHIKVLSVPEGYSLSENDQEYAIGPESGWFQLDVYKSSI